jgi:CRP-like cAMP-binding protein
MPKRVALSGRVGNDGPARAQNERAGTPANDGVSPHSPTQNLILAKLPPAELAAVSEDAERVAFATRDLLFESGDPITEVYFPVSAMISLLTVLSDGTSIEAMTIGYEGMGGMSLFHGAKTAQSKGVCQIEGEVYRLPAASFLAILKNAPVLTSMLLKYSQFMQDSMAQSAACNGIHLLEQRCARWLLLSSDAVGEGHFSLTQEFFAQMLAVRRSGVTTTMGALERKSLIATRYGVITIVDREGLARIACECYETVSNRRRELLA